MSWAQVFVVLAAFGLAVHIVMHKGVQTPFEWATLALWAAVAALAF